MPLFALVRARPGGHKKLAGVEFEIYLPYILVYKTTIKVQKPTLKNWVVSYNEYKSRILFLHEDFNYLKNALVRQRACLKHF